MNDKDRVVSFRYGEYIGVRVQNPITIQKEFDLSKDAKFSIRTLTLLCVFAIGCFGFGINPKFFGFELTSNYSMCALFVMSVILGQGVIALFHYKLNKHQINNQLLRLAEEKNKLKYEYDEIKQMSDKAYVEYKKAHNGNFPVIFGRISCDSKQELELARKKQKKQIDEAIKDRKHDYNNANLLYYESKCIYKYINGWITLFLTITAVFLCVYACFSEKALLGSIDRSYSVEETKGC